MKESTGGRRCHSVVMSSGKIFNLPFVYSCVYAGNEFTKYTLGQGCAKFPDCGPHIDVYTG